MDQTKLTAQKLNGILPYCFGNEIEYLENLAKILPDYASCVILGAGPGIQSMSLKQGNPTLRIIAVDFSQAVINTYRAHLNAAGFSTSVFIGKTIDPLPLEHTYPDYIPVQLLIVDADHSEQAVTEDITLWWPELAKGAIIFIHDYVDTELNGTNGTKQAVEYLCTKGVMSNGASELIAEPGISRVYRKVK
jgi:predicted O-methyltransferase YrrM